MSLQIARKLVSPRKILTDMGFDISTMSDAKTTFNKDGTMVTTFDEVTHNQWGITVHRPHVLLVKERSIELKAHYNGSMWDTLTETRFDSPEAMLYHLNKYAA